MSNLAAIRQSLWLPAILQAVPFAGAAEEGVAVEQSPCSAAESRRFDYRIGTFDVTTSRGQPAGTSTVESVLGGCLLVEHWRGAQGGDGRAHYFYDQREERWHLLFVNDEGHVLQLDGQPAADGVVFAGTAAFHAYRGLHRMTFTALEDGGVRQFWEWSADGGQSWATVLDAHYRRRR